MSSIDHAKALNSLLRKIRADYQPHEHVPRGLVEEFVYSFLLWDSSHAKAELAYKRMSHAMVDLNELRVARPPEIIALLGKQYPRAEERAQRLRASLNELYIREYQVTLEQCRPMNKREARQYIETLEGTPPFVAARLILLALDGHAVPIDERTLSKLQNVGVIEPGLDVLKAEGIFERHVKSTDAAATHALLQAWSEDPDSAPAPKPAAPKAAAAKTASSPKRAAPPKSSAASAKKSTPKPAARARSRSSRASRR